MTTLEKVKQALAEQLDLDADEIRDDMDIMEELGADSLDLVELLTTMESEYGFVLILDENTGSIRSVRDVAAFIDAQLR